MLNFIENRSAISEITYENGKAHPASGFAFILCVSCKNYIKYQP